MPPSAVTSTSSIIIRITLVHPFATSWPSSPKGDARALRDLPFCVIWHDKHSGEWLTAFATPYPASPDFPLCRGQNKAPRNTLFISRTTISTGYSAPACGGKVVVPATKGGMHFQRPQGGCKGFRRQRRHKKWRQRRRTSPAQRYYITPEGESPQPVREASAGPGQNPWRPGPEARRRHQPSRRSRVNLREYWQAPPRSRSRPRHRRPTTTL